MRNILLVLILAASWAVGCGDDGGLAVDENGLPVCDVSGAAATLLKADRYFMALELAPVGGLQVFFRVDVVASESTILQFELWAVSQDKTWESDAPVQRACDVPVVDGDFRIAWDGWVVPGPATPTGSDVEVTGTVLNGTLLDSQTFCGEVTGFVPLIDAALDGSAFRGVPDGTEATPPGSSCDAAGPDVFDPIDACPTLALGMNTITSAGLERRFEVRAPDGATGALPVVFLFHGAGGDGADILAKTGWDAVQAQHDFLLVLPEGARDDDGEPLTSTGWTTLQPRFDRDNIDIVFFDDMLTCLGESFDVDAERIYVTGMGGLITVMLALTRADVLAAVAPLSGAFQFDFPSGVRPVPFMVSWGGPADSAFGIDFDAANEALLTYLDGNGNVHLACEHDLGHAVPDGLVPAQWEFFSSATLTSPPDWSALPGSFPSFCALR